MFSHPIDTEETLTEVLLQHGARNSTMSKIFARFAKDESGATAIEYGLIAALIALAIITGAGFIGEQLEATFDDIGNSLEGAQR